MTRTRPPRTPEIEDAERDVQRLHEALGVAERHLAELRAAQAEFKVGEVVEAWRRLPRGQGEWQPAIVREVNVSGFHDWYRVAFRRKDGSWADALSHVFSGVRAAP